MTSSEVLRLVAGTKPETEAEPGRARSAELRPEVDVNVRYLAVGEFEVLDVAEPWSVELGRPVSDQGILGVRAEVQQREGLDGPMARPAPIEVRGSVDPVVVGTGEGEPWV